MHIKQYKLNTNKTTTRIQINDINLPQINYFTEIQLLQNRDMVLTAQVLLNFVFLYLLCASLSPLAPT